MTVDCGKYEDIEAWMKLVQAVRSNFPGLETLESINEHKCTVLKFMIDQRAICVKALENVVGVLLFSKQNNKICCLAVLPEYRKQGIASKLLSTALEDLDRTKNITVSTFRESDPKGIAPRELYKKFGFVEAELIEEFGYPNQRFILYP